MDANASSDTERERFHVCVTCGRLKHEELFREGACTCDDCKDRGNEAVNWVEAPDGDGFVRGKRSDCSEANDRSRDTGGER